MCKMFAAAGRFSALDIEARAKLHVFMSDLYCSTQHDGQDQDAAGFFAMNGDRCHHDRVSGDCRRLIELSSAWAGLEQNPCSMYLCHARGAMSDATNPNNNHPFVGDNIALMHEGWISDHRDRAKTLGLKLTTDTDSEYYMRLLDNPDSMEDPTLALRVALATTTEPTALAFIDHSSPYPKIWFGVNDSGGNHPFFFYRIQRFNGVFLVSTEEMMQIASHLAFAYPDEAVKKVKFDVEPFKIYKMDPKKDCITIYEP